jgi:NAD(P)-dependent dehydrogenase (short-subunit alcohol dehydrogenase family)
MSPRDRAVVVTGGAAGIGRAAVERFAAAGDRVFVLDRDADALAGLGQQVTGLAVDVADRAGLAAAAQQVGEALAGAPLSALVCAAGIQRYGTVVDTPAATFDEVVAVNVGGVFFACQSFLPLIPRGGSVVVVASVQAYAAQHNVAAYSMGKGALLALVRAMAVDHAAEGIRVNAVCPGSTRTPLLEGFMAQDPAIEKMITRASPLGRLGTPEEIAAAVVWLCSDDASFVVGHALVADAGATIQ